jgi:uncharacterized protein (TIGR00661 family)
MKIFYAIQATGNGHIARAIELMPYLKQYGEVDVFLSGSNSNLNPSLPVKYRSKGVSLFYGNSGGLDYRKILKEFSPVRTYREARDLPLERYDIVINDFEPVTSLACRLKKIPSINFGHQASFVSANTPRPKQKDIAGELVLKQYAPATSYVGLHFKQYDDFIFQPIIKEQILYASPDNKGYITVYLSHYSDEVVADKLKRIKDVRFEVFSKKVKEVRVDGNITFLPISNEAFNKSMIYADGIITGAGFETPAEALYMGKKLLCLPIKGQYEQLCNAEAIKQFGATVIDTIDDNFVAAVTNWLSAAQPQQLILTNSTYDIVRHVIEKARLLRRENNSKPAALLTDEDFLVLG